MGRDGVTSMPLVDNAGASQAVILAAGRGQRLGMRVEEIPKCLLEVGGRTLLDHQLEMLAAAGVRNVCVVTGYHHDVVVRACHNRVHVIQNPKWASTNSLYSLWLARNWVTASLVVMNCDVLADQRVLSRLMNSTSSSFAFDSSSGAADEHMKVELFGNTLKSMSKSLDNRRTHGENVGMLKFTAPDARDLFSQAGQILENGGGMMWMAAAVQKLAHDRALLGVDVRDLSWIEIDYEEDLEEARARIWPSMGVIPGQVQLELPENSV